MRKSTFVLSLILMLLYFSTLFSQYNNEISAGVAPWLPVNGNYNLYARSVLTNPHSTGYSYYSIGASGSQLFRYSVGAPGNTTLIGGVKPYFLGNGDFASPTGVWKFYVQDQNTPPYTIYEVDTATGNLTSVGAPNNLKSGHKPIDMEWDQTTNTFYLLSTDSALTETQLYRMNWSTKDLYWIGPPASAPAAIVAGGFNASGSYFGIDLLTDALWKLNKNTGNWTLVGSLGYPVNYSQDAGFDRGDYSKMLWCACGGTVGLYEVDTANAGIYLIGTFPSSYTQVMAAGFVSGFGPQITITKLLNTPDMTGPYTVNAVATPNGSGIAYTKLFWSRNNTVFTDSVNMTNTGGNNWTASIPGNGSPAIYRYYGYTKDSLGRFAVAPIGAPANFYSFIATATDTSKPVITHIPIGTTPRPSWPVSVTANVTDDFGIDSVWVRWKRNSNPAKTFKLNNISGSTYNASFNSVNSEVFFGDTIYYRIIAQDNSTGHNKDSTSLYGFLIASGEYTCIGNGNIELTFAPYNTSYYGDRTQMLWTAQEILNNGGSLGLITKIGFNIGTAHPYTMNNFSVKMQATTDTAVSAFVENNWTTVYAGVYTVPTVGWQYIDFQNPFDWDGINNILIQICYENSTNGMWSSVKGYTSPFRRMASEFHDLSNACTAFQSPIISKNRPNVCFKILGPLQSNNNSGNISTVYKLSQNYPNPFNPVTRIKFDVPKQGFVSLKIYDVLGKMVNILVNEIKSQGQYSVDYNASGLPSGVYFYKLECNGFSDVKRMLLIK